jgi:DNA replication protein DnaC
MDWIEDISDTSQCFFWLSGDPGVGKSAITASIAKESKRRGVLWAQFFINRNDARTVDPRLFFPPLPNRC